MNVKQARELRERVKNHLVSDKELEWIKISLRIFDEIKNSILTNNDFVIVRIEDENILEIVKFKLELEGYEVRYLFNNNEFNRKDIIVKW